MAKVFLDTSAVLAGEINNHNRVYLSPITLAELENIKTSDKKPDNIKYLAREAVRDILKSSNVTFTNTNNKKIDKLLKKYNFLSNINDHRILCEAILCADGEQVEFYTNDATQYIFAKRIKGIDSHYIQNKILEINHAFCGWGKYFPGPEVMAMLYSDPKVNSLHCKINEFAEIFEGSQLKDILFWNGSEYTKLKYKDIKNPYTGETIKPRNLEQKMAFHMLQNQSIKVKLLTSAWGSGKTLLALNYALEQIGAGKYQKLVFVRNNIVVSDTKDIGFLPGDVRAKMSIWGGVIADHLGGQEMLDHLIDEGTVEIFPLSHIRGRSIRSSIVLCDECENLNDKLVTLLLSRIEEDSEIIFCGDVAQIDDKRFERNNGIHAMINALAGNPLFGMVKLIKSERGAVPKLCDLMIPPR